MAKLDFKTPFDELRELRTALTAQQIAELTGLRRETISRARPDSRFQRRTEKALGDLYAVVTRMRSVAGADIGQLAVVLSRPQAALGQRSIADLLREGRADLVLEHLDPPDPTGADELANFRLSPELEARLTASEERSGGEVVKDPTPDERISALLAAEPDLDSRLGAIEAAILESFGPKARIERTIIDPYDVPGGREELYLRVHTKLGFDEEIDRLGDLLRQEEELLGPVMSRLTIGFL
jgi:hypothetical protein